jgi:hypothetical protein
MDTNWQLRPKKVSRSAFTTPRMGKWFRSSDVEMSLPLFTVLPLIQRAYGYQSAAIHVMFTHLR